MSEGAWGTATDPLYEQAVALVRKHKLGSISLVQRHLQIGWNRAHGMVSAMVGTVITDMPPIGKVIPHGVPEGAFFRSEDIAKAVMTPEQEAAVRDRNWCWKCASAMVVDVHREAGVRWMQCKHCKTIYALTDGVKEDQRG